MNVIRQLLMAGLILRLLPAGAAQLYHLPFQDGAGDATLANYGSVGGAATVFGGTPNPGTGIFTT
ncbi:MAG: hypothetical protein WCP86_08585, partial [bacterium]